MGGVHRNSRWTPVPLQRARVLLERRHQLVDARLGAGLGRVEPLAVGETLA